jgi:hypothetical protein
MLRRTRLPSTSRPPHRKRAPLPPCPFTAFGRVGGATAVTAGDVRGPDGVFDKTAGGDAGKRAALRREDATVRLLAALVAATTATLLLDTREPIESVQELLDHKHITTTQIYDKRRRSVRDSASHKVPL